MAPVNFAVPVAVAAARGRTRDSSEAVELTGMAALIVTVPVNIPLAKTPWYSTVVVATGTTAAGDGVTGVGELFEVEEPPHAAMDTHRAAFKKQEIVRVRSIGLSFEGVSGWTAGRGRYATHAAT
jgi:hypothetical protein